MTAEAATLEPLRCHACDGCVPLVDAPTAHCPFCQATVEIPAAYRELHAHQLEAAALRREAEPLFERLSSPPARWLDVLPLVLVTILPAIASSLVVLHDHHLAIVTIFIVVVVPALIPGTALWVWTVSIHATVTNFQLALASAPPERPGGPACCRECGAPLTVEPGALSATCHYCGADSLVSNLHAPTDDDRKVLHADLHTLADANRVLLLRRRLLVIGAVLAALVLAGLALAAAWSYGHLRSRMPRL